MLMLSWVVSVACAASGSKPVPQAPRQTAPLVEPAAPVESPGADEDAAEAITFGAEPGDSLTALPCDSPRVAVDVAPLASHPRIADDDRRAFERLLEDSVLGPVTACFVDISPAANTEVQADLVWDGRSIRVETPGDGGWQAFSDCVENAAADQRTAFGDRPPARAQLHAYTPSCPSPLQS